MRDLLNEEMISPLKFKGSFTIMNIGCTGKKCIFGKDIYWQVKRKKLHYSWMFKKYKLRWLACFKHI